MTTTKKTPDPVREHRDLLDIYWSLVRDAAADYPERYTDTQVAMIHTAADLQPAVRDAWMAVPETQRSPHPFMPG
jgi:hypothetical protein